MANLEKSGTAATPVRQAAGTAETEGLPALVGRLGDDVMTLVDTKLSLLKVEVKEDAAAYMRGGATMAFGGILATVGLALLNIAIAFFVSRLFTFSDQRFNYAVGFLITGVFYLVIGGIVVVVMKNRLAARDPVPNRSVDELRKDKQWLKNEL